MLRGGSGGTVPGRRRAVRDKPSATRADRAGRRITAVNVGGVAWGDSSRTGHTATDAPLMESLPLVRVKVASSHGEEQRVHQLWVHFPSMRRVSAGTNVFESFIYLTVP
ncbi:hypothetical protein GCM10018787_25790 [Streptomyces thermodiastaticus]|nr:hypothetical protein GCM10018787_25790 [Streptomyces thermodiastaticus]